MTLLEAAEPFQHRLRAWRDAAVNGDLPTPGRIDRWQPLRAGVVNMWEFEVAEYWFADGRTQLTGKNESGKSTLMALTTLILFAGDTSPYNIDTLGGSAKKFRYYLEPSDSDADRRPATKNMGRGWAWVEFGRLTGDGPRFVTAALYAQVRRSDRSPQLTWVVCEGMSRVRHDIVLVRDDQVVEPGDASPGADWHAFPSDATSYRKQLAKSLFRSDTTKLDGLVRMLRVIRTPKLGANLDLPFLSEKLREALPPLSAHEVTQLATGWDELARIAAERDSAEEARQIVAEFEKRVWRPWASAEVRIVADRLIAANTDVDNVTRDARTAKKKSDEAGEALAKLDKKAERAGKRRRELDDERTGLLRSQGYLDADAALRDAESLAEQAATARDDAEEWSARAERDAGRAVEAQKLADKKQKTAERLRGEMETRLGLVGGSAVEAGISAAREWLAAGDVDRLGVAVSERLGRAADMQSLLDSLGQRSRNVEQAELVVADRGGRLNTAKTASERANAHAEAQAQRIAERLADWCLNVDPPPVSEVRARWNSLIDDHLGGTAPPRTLREQVSHDYLNPIRDDMAAQQAAAEAEAKIHRTRIGDLNDQIDDLEGETEPSYPPPRSWTRRNRPEAGAIGAPLWRLLDPSPTTSQLSHDRIEAALAAAGILDAWVTVDGVWTAGLDSDTILAAADDPFDGPSLASCLQPAKDAGPLTAPVTRFLEAAAWVDGDGSLPDTVLAVGLDGRWRTRIATGRAEPTEDGASYIGTAARAAALARRLARLVEDRDNAAAVLARCIEEIDTAKDAITLIGLAEQALPDDQPLAIAVARASDAEEAVEQASAEFDEANKATRTAKQYEDTARAAAAEWSSKYRLPRTPEAVTDLTRRLHALEVDTAGLRSDGKRLETAREVAEQARVTSATQVDDAAETQGTAQNAIAKAATLKIQADAARTALTGEAQEVLKRVRTLGMRIDQFDDGIETMRAKRAGLHATKIEADILLKQVDAEAEAKRAVRDDGTERWWEMVGSNLPNQLGVSVGENRVFTSALESAREARSVLTVDSWPERDHERQLNHTRLLFQRMNQESSRYRSRLEADAGRTIRISEPDDSSGPQRVEVLVDSTGAGYSPPDAVILLAKQHQELRESYDHTMHATLHELLGSTFIEHLRERLGEVATLHRSINKILEDHPTGTTGTMLRLQRKPVDDDREAAQVLEWLEDRGYALLTEDAQIQVRQFLQTRIDDARQAAVSAGDTDWTDRLNEALDYRRWFEVTLEKRAGADGRWQPLTTRTHSELSGGARVVTLILPLVAALAAMYEAAADGPRLVWLDEAFDGVDRDNRASILGLLHEFDLDFLLAGPGLMIDAASVPCASVYEIARAPQPDPGVDLLLMLWSSGHLEAIDLPDPADVAREAARRRPRKRETAST